MIYDERYYGVGNNDPGQELCTSLPVLLTYTAPRVVFEIDLETGPQPGEILQMTARLETTTPYTYNISVIDCLYLNTVSAAGTAGVLPGNAKGLEIMEDLGENLTQSIHHGVAAAARQWRCKESDGDLSQHRYLQYTITAASSAAQSGHALQVMQDYGQMDCLRKTPIAEILP